MEAEKQLELTERREIALELPALPPLPVFDEHIQIYEQRADSFLAKGCENETDFELAKRISQDGVRLKNQIVNDYRTLKQAIDAIKQPVLDRENGYLAKLKGCIDAVDAMAIAFQREQDRLAREKAEKAAEAERQRKLKEQQDEAALLKEWGDEAGAVAVASKPIEEPRPVAVSAGFTYRRGAKTKPKLKARVVDDGAVKREFCSPDLKLIQYKVDQLVALSKTQPDEATLKDWAAKIGGVVLGWE